MIDPKEVRVGNWVIKITGTDVNTQSFFEYKAIALDEYYYSFAKVCFPIKITTAILGTSGFKQKFGDWLQAPVKLTTVRRFKLTSAGRCKLTTLSRSKLTT